MAGASREGSEGARSPVTICGAEDPAAEGGGPGGFTFSADPSLEDIRRLQAEFVAERGWGRFHQPRNLLLALVGEVGEVAELFQWRAEPEARAGLPGWAPGERAALAEELSDVLLYLVSLAQQCRVDLPRAALRKLDRNRARYPADRAHGSARKYTHYQAGPMDAQRRDGPTDTHYQAGPTDAQRRDGPTDTHYQAGPTDAQRRDGPTDTHYQAGPTDAQRRDGPTDTHYQAGPTDAQRRDGPTDAHYQAGPTDAQRRDGPTDAHYQAGPTDAQRRDGPTDTCCPQD